MNNNAKIKRANFGGSSFLENYFCPDYYCIKCFYQHLSKKRNTNKYNSKYEKSYNKKVYNVFTLFFIPVRVWAISFPEFQIVIF